MKSPIVYYLRSNFAAEFKTYFQIFNTLMGIHSKFKNVKMRKNVTCTNCYFVVDEWVSCKSGSKRPNFAHLLLCLLRVREAFCPGRRPHIGPIECLSVPV